MVVRQKRVQKDAHIINVTISVIVAPFRGTGKEERGAGFGKMQPLYFGKCEVLEACATFRYSQKQRIRV